MRTIEILDSRRYLLESMCTKSGASTTAQGLTLDADVRGERVGTVVHECQGADSGQLLPFDATPHRWRGCSVSCRCWRDVLDWRQCGVLDRQCERCGDFAGAGATHSVADADEVNGGR